MSLRCGACGLNKDENEFYANNSPKSRGTTYKCKTCSSAYANAWALSKKYPTPCTRCRKHRRLDSNLTCGPCNRAEGLQQCRGPCGALLPLLLSFPSGRNRWCKECHNAKRRANHDPKRAAERSRRWYSNPINRRVHRLRRRALENDAPGTCTADQLRARLTLFGWTCWMCRAPYEAIDHVIPLSKGGTNWPANLRPACKSCNNRKGAKDWRLFSPSNSSSTTGIRDDTAPPAAWAQSA